MDQEWNAHDAKGLEHGENLLIALNKLISEYSKEAIHQDGHGYWNNFSTVTELLEDLTLYSRFRDGEYD